MPASDLDLLANREPTGAQDRAKARLFPFSPVPPFPLIADIGVRRWPRRPPRAAAAPRGASGFREKYRSPFPARAALVPAASRTSGWVRGTLQ